MTVYGYKVVHITTLDGERQHRPLLTAYIERSCTETWQTIFDLFSEYVLGSTGLS